MQGQKTTFLDKFYMLVLVLLPVISQYQLGPLDLDVVLMALVLLVMLGTTRFLRITEINRRILVIVLYILVVTVLNLLFGEKFSKEGEIILRMGRYCMYLVVVFFFGNEHASYAQLMRIYRVIAWAASIYILIQAVFYYGAGIVLPNKIGGSTVSDNLADVGRLRSFYSEPAELGYNLMPFLVCSLFGEPYKQHSRINQYVDALLVSVAVIVSTSGQGVLTAGVVWGCWFLVRMVSNGMKVRELVLVLVVLVAAVALYSTGILEFTLNRMETSGNTGAISARSSGYQSLSLLTPIQLLIGTGFGNFVVENRFGLDMVYEFVNYSSIAEFLFTLGIIGTTLWLVFFTKVFRKGKLCVKMLLVAMFTLSLLGCPMTGKHFPLWLTLMGTQLPGGLFAKKNNDTTVPAQNS